MLATIDPIAAEWLSRLGGVERGTLRAICLHAVKPSSTPSVGVPPDFETERSQLRLFVEALLNHGYEFVTPSHLSSLDPDGRYVMVTFDDGYFSTSAAVETMRDYGLCMTIFMAPYFADRQAAHWSDALFRGFEKQKIPAVEQRGLINEMRSLSQPEREIRLTALFGPDSLKPLGDWDRSLTKTELQSLWAMGNVEVGNHTWSHVDLTQLTDVQIDEELRLAQQWITSAIGVTPSALAFPYGRYDARTLAAAKRLGFTSVFTTESTRHSVRDVEQQSFRQIGRFGSWSDTKRPLRQHVLRMRCGQLLSDRILSLRATRGAAQ